jgi:hypothetical protein
MRQSQVRVSRLLSSPFEVLSGFPDVSVMGPLLSIVFINDLHNAINYSIYLLFNDDIKIYSSIKSPEDVNMLHSQTDSAQGSCTTKVTSF